MFNYKVWIILDQCDDLLSGHDSQYPQAAGERGVGAKLFHCNVNF